jgi:hypothetical protein
MLVRVAPLLNILKKEQQGIDNTGNCCAYADYPFCRRATI